MAQLKEFNIPLDGGGIYFTVKELNSIKDLWESIYYQGPNNYSPFSSYEFINLWAHLYKRKRSRRHFSPTFFLYSEQDQNVCIFCFSINHKTKKIVDISCFGPLDYFDVLSSTSDVDFVCRGLVSFLGHYDKYEISFENINCHSLLHKAFEKKRLCLNQDICVHIKLSYHSFQDYLFALSKHQRQNYRTAINRITKDQKTVSFTVFSKKEGKISFLLWIKCIIIYIKRTLSKNHISESNIKTILSIIRKNIFDPINWIPKLNQHLIFVLFINKTPVGYCACLHEPSSNTIFIPRIAFDEKYQRYDPGNSLIYRIIDYSIKEGIKIVDLTRGDERYKYMLGGEEHQNYSFQGYCCDLINKLL